MPVVQFLLRNLLVRTFQIHYLLGNWDNDLLLPYCLLIKRFWKLSICLLNWEKCLGIVKLFAFGNLCRIFHFDGQGLVWKTFEHNCQQKNKAINKTKMIYFQNVIKVPHCHHFLTFNILKVCYSPSMKQSFGGVIFHF